MYRSWVSNPMVVNPQAIRSLCPAMMPGNPGKENPRAWNALPVASSREQCRPTSYHREGMVRSRCMSLARIGDPVLVRFPETTQLLEPPFCKSEKSGSLQEQEEDAM